MNTPHPFRLLRRALPHGLFGRSLIIIITPVVVLQAVVTYAFFVRHYDIMTMRMTRGVAADVAFLVNLAETHPEEEERTTLLEIAARNLSYQISFVAGQHITGSVLHRAPHINDVLTAAFVNQLGERHAFTSRIVGDYLDLGVDLKSGTLHLMIPKERMIAGTANIFILWMVISSLVLLAVAIIFLRNQVRPIERLAIAAEAFGRGRAVPDFRPRGATEVRRAAQAFITMRERIDRYVQQRTEMLAGVSHDLKTPLTRFKLQLAMMGTNADTDALRQDVADMERMLDEYLQFARGEGGETSESTDLSALVRQAAETAARGKPPGRLSIDIPQSLTLSVKRNALGRCLGNLIENALKHGTHVKIALRETDRHDGHSVDIVVDDDGPGIPAARREEAFRPFHRLDEGRNLQAGGSGLGLAIARDIARAQGGDLTLHTSPMGGLRAVIRLPA